MESILEQDNTMEEAFVISKMTRLLTKIYETNFFEDTITSEQEPIEEIKKSVHINLTNNCNMRCKHCYMSAGIIPEQRIEIEEIISKVEEINKEIGFTNIVISGGEPLTFPNILELLNMLSKNDITLFTNGTLITNENYETICNSCKEIQISFEGLSERGYENVRGKGNYSKVIKAIDLIKSKNVRLILAITVLPDYVNEIKENLIKFVENLSYDNIEIRLNSEIELSGNALNLNFENYDKNEVDKVILSLMKELKDMGISIEYNSGRNIHFQNCGIGANIIINYDGNIYPCFKFTDIKKSMTDSIIEVFQDFNDLNLKTSAKYIERCQKCELKYICAGGCRIDNYLATGSMLVPNCDERYKENQYRRIISEYLRG